jgi:hypothetical protein
MRVESVGSELRFSAKNEGLTPPNKRPWVVLVGTSWGQTFAFLPKNEDLTPPNKRPYRTKA